MASTLKWNFGDLELFDRGPMTIEHFLARACPELSKKWAERRIQALLHASLITTVPLYGNKVAYVKTQ